MAIGPISKRDAPAGQVIASSQSASSGVMHAAAIIALGNIASRILGLAREILIAYLFGAPATVSLFRVASTIVQTLYDFLVGGMVSAALVPLFSELAERRERGELWHVANLVFGSIALGLAAAVLILELLAPQLVWMLGSGYDPALQGDATGMIRLILPAVFFLGMSGVVSGLLYALKRFSYPAFATATYNAGIVIVAILLAPVLGINSLILGVLAGSALQVAFQLRGLRDMHWRFSFDWNHPALRRILRLYLPVFGGLCISVFGVIVDRNLASHTGSQSLAWMQAATVLTQLPLGLVATAISFAILPELSRQAAQTSPVGLSSPPAEDGEFSSTLAYGLKLVLLIIVPAAVGLFVLAQPIVTLVFQHGAFTATDTFWTAAALRLYVIGLPFAAIDQPLVFAFYSRRDTLAPNLVACAGVGIYLLVALTLIVPFGMLGLVLANAAQLSGHALLMLSLIWKRWGGLGRNGVVTLLKNVTLASAVMGGVALGLQSAIEGASGPLYLQLLCSGTAAIITYIVLLRILSVAEARQIWDGVIARVRAV